MPTRPRENGTTAKPKLEEAANAASSAVRQAASVLEEQLAAGLVEVKRVTGALAERRPLDRAEFDDMVTRFRTNAHEFIDQAAAQVGGLRSDDVQDLTRRLTTDAHDVFDTVLDLVVMAPEIVSRAAEMLPARSGETRDPARPVPDERSKEAKDARATGTQKGGKAAATTKAAKAAGAKRAPSRRGS